jgi:signal transduction histidine kinase
MLLSASSRIMHKEHDIAVTSSVSKPEVPSKATRDETLLACIAEAVETLLQEPVWEDGVGRALEQVGEVLELDRISLFEHDVDPDTQETIARRFFQWVRDARTQRVVDPAPAMLRYAYEFAHWHAAFVDGKGVAAQTSDLPPRGQKVLASMGIAAVLAYPVMQNTACWGFVSFEACSRPRSWSGRADAAIKLLASGLNSALQRRGQSASPPEGTKSESRGGEREDVRDAKMHRQAARIEHRIKIEGALVEASHLLVSAGEIDFERILGIIGEAVDAERVYLITVPPDDQPLQEIAAGMSLTAWQKEPGATDDWWPVSLESAEPELHLLAQERAGRAQALATRSGEPAALAVPVLSPQDKLYGYVGFEYGERPQEWLVEDIRVLSVLGDMLSTYFERKLAEQALRESEERYRTFVDTISEAIWRIELTKPVAMELPARAQFQHIREWSVLAECNEVMARLLGSLYPARLVGQKLESVLPHLDEQLVEDFVESGYRLRSREYSVHPQGQPSRHFVINAVGTVEQGRLVRIWGSSIEVTGRVELERRMVGALEEQQQRIGRDLHDGVGQLLTGVRMLSRNLADRYFNEHDDGSVQAHKVARFAEEASQRVRDIYRGLTPVQLYNEGLAAALEELAHNTDVLPGITCTFVHDGITDVTESEAKLHLYRIAQEATNNALKHARPKNIWIALQKQRNLISLQIKDDGLGFERRRTGGKSLGLSSMYYRARAVKATLKISSRPGSGTVVRCTLPADAAEAHRSSHAQV